LVLTTGNKSELAVGYSTIYGDSVGGFAPIKDVEKSLVWELAKYRNAIALEAGLQPPIPESSISKPPSAELRPGQLDQDSLPDYQILDEILRLHIEERLPAKELVRLGLDEVLVDQVLKMVKSAEWKRRQGAIGPRITKLAFGRERRMPITNGSN
jgi:NAD+ synthase (glutamine-hydrolysing)